jgi:predicted 3-demethylubiquinone-9 3-methyltransferase (glyoxalase superfamily)
MAASAKVSAPTVTPFLMFAKGCGEAVDLYMEAFPDGRILSKSIMQGPDGPMVNVTFEVGGQRFRALDGGPTFSFTEGISLFIECSTQKEVDHFWETLSKGGSKGRCGWLTDRFGVSWQVIPAQLGRMLGDGKSGNPAKAMQAMLGMKKLDIAKLEAAYRSK